MPGRALDPTFTALPYRDLGDAALSRARELGATHADFRFERVRYQTLVVRDGVLQGANDTEDLGFAVRVIHGGAWGFASGVVLTPEEAVRVAETAVAVAQVAAADDQRAGRARRRAGVRRRRVGLGVRREPVRRPDRRRRPRCSSTGPTGCAPARRSTTPPRTCSRSQENKYYADLAGTRTTQQRVRVHPGFEAMGAGADTFDSMASIAPPVGRGWEYLTGGAGSWDWDAEIEQVPELLAEKLKAPSVEAGTYDLVIHPSNLWLTIHESIGHATELDRALGYEANYAGTSFATPDKLNTLQYGSPVMNVTGDRTVEHGLATIGYDDEGVADAGLGHRP